MKQNKSMKTKRVKLMEKKQAVKLKSKSRR